MAAGYRPCLACCARAQMRTKVVGLEAGSADQRAVDVGLLDELGGVARGDAPAVLDAIPVGHAGQPFRQQPADAADRLWACGPCAARPVPMAQIGS